MIKKIFYPYFKVQDDQGKDRLCFLDGIVNSRNQPGKNGIVLVKKTQKTESAITLFGDNIETQEIGYIHLNKKSFVKWLNPQLKAEKRVFASADNEFLIQKLNKVLAKRKKSEPLSYLGKVKISNIAHPSIKIQAKAAKKCVTAEGDLRKILKNTEVIVQKVSKLLAVNTYWAACRTNEAYRMFIENKFGRNITEFTEIPLMTKKNYLKCYGLKRTSAANATVSQLPSRFKVGTIDPHLKSFLANTVMKGPKEIFINTFPKNSYSKNSQDPFILSLGNDQNRILQVISQQKQEILLMGYPLFLKKLAQLAKKRNTPFSNSMIRAVVCGDWMSEKTREKLLYLGYSEVISLFQITDVGTIGFEGEFERQLRLKCIENPQFAVELYGKNPIPPLINFYNPLHYLLEIHENKNLLVTAFEDNNDSPCIRYFTKIRAHVMALSDVIALMKKHRIHLEDEEGKKIYPKGQLPLLFYWPIKGGDVYFQGAKLTLNELEYVATQLDIQFENLGFSTYQDIHLNDRIQILIELEKNTTLKRSRSYWENKILTHLAEINSDFKIQMEMAHKNVSDTPDLVIFRYGEGPMANASKNKLKHNVYTGNFDSNNG